jgi:hypothetical protein
MDMKGSFHRAFFRSWSSFVALLGCPSSQIAPKGALGTFRKRSSKFILDWPPNLPDIIYYRNLSCMIIYSRYLTNTPIINMLSWYVMISYISIYICIFIIYTYDEWHICVQIFTLHKLWVNWSPTGHQVTSELLAALMERESKTSAEKVGCWTASLSYGAFHKSLNKRWGIHGYPQSGWFTSLTMENKIC